MKVQYIETKFTEFSFGKLNFQDEMVEEWRLKTAARGAFAFLGDVFEHLIDILLKWDNVGDILRFMDGITKKPYFHIENRAFVLHKTIV